MGQHEVPVAAPMTLPRAIVAPGNYDGVHLGHRALLATARDAARPGEPVTVLTFDPHPAVVLSPLRAPTPLTLIARREALLRRLGADVVEVVRFDKGFAAQSAEAFVADVLVRRLHARAVVVGPDFRFGKGRTGGVATLREAGLEAREVAPVEHDGAVVSSTRIRGALREGHVEDAARWLGRVHDVGGTVVRGDGRGRTIGVPTANLACEPVLLPADGVYAVVARVAGDDAVLRGVANLGVRPTVGAGRSVEAHFFDFEGDLYDRDLRLGFVTRLRGEQRFDGLPALTRQIALDAARARADLDAAHRESWSLL
ncbi:MAG: bifunctional riboflavin kinase/FAD synthetase [Sandaracinaceae bacterium]|nr:bifunctional riboflavin kinase/FAD synthetase [Sandaracinaceae bacterium]